MLLALTGGQKIALLGFAGVFILFAIAASFLFPRRDPNWPGERGLRLFVVVSIALFIAMIGAMYAFAREAEEPHGGGDAAGIHETVGPGETAPEEGPAGETTGGETTGGETTGGGEEGDAGAGEGVFAESGCGACHTFAAAGSSGNVGPNLDDASPSFELAVETITNGRGGMPPFKDGLSEEQIRDVAAFVSGSR